MKRTLADVFFPREHTIPEKEDAGFRMFEAIVQGLVPVDEQLRLRAGVLALIIEDAILFPVGVAASGPRTQHDIAVFCRPDAARMVIFEGKEFFHLFRAVILAALQ